MSKTTSGQVGPRTERTEPRKETGKAWAAPLHRGRSDPSGWGSRLRAKLARSPRAPGNSGRTANGKSRPPACGRRTKARAGYRHARNRTPQSQKDKREKKKERGRGQGGTLRCQAGKAKEKLDPVRKPPKPPGLPKQAVWGPARRHGLGLCPPQNPRGRA